MFKRTDFQPIYKHHLSKGLSGFTLKFFYEENDLDVDVYLPSYGCNLQRGHVWTLQQKQAFIEACLRGLQFPPIVMVRECENVNDKRQKIKILDGKQRLTALKEFKDGKFSFPFKGVDIWFSDLELVLKSDIEHLHHLKFDVHYSYKDEPITDDVLVEIFENCNFKGTPQDVDHIEKIKQRKQD